MNIIKSNDVNFLKYWKMLGDNKIEGTFFSPLEIAFSIEYANKSSFEDYSFIIVENQKPIIATIMSLEIKPDKSKFLAGFGRPICMIEDVSDTSLLKRAQKLHDSEFKKIIELNSTASIYYQDFLNNSTLSFLGRKLLDIGATATPYFSQIIDLTHPKEYLWTQMRKSYKSLINWGIKNLNQVLLDHKTITMENVEAFRQLHIQVAGRETRSQKTWEIQYETVKNKEGFVILGYLENELVTASYFIHNSFSCYYGVSASIRELFDKPLLHSSIWKAIEYSKDLGCKLFEPGEQLFPNQGNPSKKQLGISNFKKGFGGNTKTRLDIWWHSPK